MKGIQQGEINKEVKTGARIFIKNYKDSDWSPKSHKIII